LDPAIKPFGTTVKKASKKAVDAIFYFVGSAKLDPNLKPLALL
jgi:hypothetical protein